MSTPAISSLKGTGYNLVQAPKYSPQGMDIYNQFKGQAQPIAQRLAQMGMGDESAYQALEAPALRQFGQLQGQIASRFSGMGTGARRSSGFQNTVTGAATDLAERLQAQRMSLQSSAIDQLRGLYGSLLEHDPYENFLMEQEQKSPWSKWIGASAPFIGAGLGAALGTFGGPGGALAGAKIGSLAGSAASKAFF